MGLLDRAGARLTNHPEEAEILIVNTCSFIDTAKQESIDTILEMARHKTSGSAKKLIVAGCLVERYRDEIRKSIPEVDAVVGTGELDAILEAAGLAAPPAALSPFNILTGASHSVEDRDVLKGHDFSRADQGQTGNGALAPEGSSSSTQPAIKNSAADIRSGRESQSGTHKTKGALAPAATSRPEGDLREQQGRIALLQNGSLRQVIQWRWTKSFAQFAHHPDNIHPTAGAENSIHSGNPPGHFQTVALGKAAGSDKDLTRAFLFGQAAQFGIGFLPGRFDKSAGIDNQNAGAPGAANRLVAILNQQLGHGIGINGILGTAKGDHVKSFGVHNNNWIDSMEWPPAEVEAYWSALEWKIRAG